MASSEIEDLKLEVIGALYTLTKDLLLEPLNVFDIRGLSLVDIKDKSRSFLITLIQRHLDREELEKLENEGMAELLMVRDQIGELKESVQASSPKDAVSDVAQPGTIQEEATQLSEQERLKN